MEDVTEGGSVIRRVCSGGGGGGGGCLSYEGRVTEGASSVIRRGCNS